MRQLVAERIVARLADIGLDAGKIRKMHVDARKLFPGQILRNGRGNKFLVLPDVAKDSRAVAVGEKDDATHRIERRLHAFERLLGNDQNAIVTAIGCEFDAETVENAAAQRRYEARTDAVLFCLGAELLAFENLQLVESDAKRAQHGADRATGHQCPAREGRVAAFVLAVEQRHQKSPRKGPTRRRWMSPKNIATST